MIAETVSPNMEEKPLLSAKMVAKPVTIVALAAFADWLFYGRVIGISLLVFLLALNVGVFFNNPVRAARRTVLIAIGAYGLAIAPLVVEVSFLSVMFAVLGTAVLVVVMVAPSLNWRESRCRLWGRCSALCGVRLLISSMRGEKYRSFGE